MKLSFSTNAFTRHSLPEAIGTIAALGYEGVEILADRPHLYPPALKPGDIENLGRLVNEKGIRVANVNANTAVGYYGRDFWEPLFEPSLANPEATARQWRVDYTRRLIEAAQALGCENVSVTSGRAVPGLSPDRSMDLLRDSLDKLLDSAEASGVRLGIEYEPGLLIERYEELKQLLDDMNSDRLGANLDLGHSRVLGEDPREVIGGLGSKIFHIHLEDIRGRKHYHLIPGTGDMDFKGLLDALAPAYRGFLTVELYTFPDRPEEAAARSIDYLQPLLTEQRARVS